MGLLEEVLAVVGSSSAQQVQHTTAIGAILSYVNSPQVGGVAGLQRMFEQGGLGSIASSWIGSGQNLPISASQLQNVLDNGALQEAAQKAGMDPSELTNLMSTLLPHLVDKLTPNGQVPDTSALQQMMKGLAAGQSS